MLTYRIDGGSRGNPGPAGYGVVVLDDSGAVVETLHASLGIQTNNYAEYQGLLAALRHARDRGETRVRILADSELLVRQMQGRYKVRSPNLLALYQEARRLAAAIADFSIAHVYRESNRDADALANQAMDAAGSRRAQPPARRPGRP